MRHGHLFAFYCSILLIALALASCRHNSEASVAATSQGPVASGYQRPLYTIYLDTMVHGEEIKVAFCKDTLMLERKTKDTTYAYYGFPGFDNERAGIDIYDGKQFYYGNFLIIDSFYLIGFRNSRYDVAMMAFNARRPGLDFLQIDKGKVRGGGSGELFNNHNNFALYDQTKKVLTYFDYYNHSINEAIAVKKCDAYQISFASYPHMLKMKDVPVDGNEFLSDSTVDLFKRKLLKL